MTFKFSDLPSDQAAVLRSMIVAWAEANHSNLGMSLETCIGSVERLMEKGAVRFTQQGEFPDAQFSLSIVTDPLEQERMGHFTM
jgi:hypothetical protein